MKYAEFQARDHFDAAELLAFSHGRLIEDPPAGFAARLPSPPFLMIDRILEISRSGPRGRIVAEQDVRLDAWFFQCHFVGDPVQPGCLGLDAIWQLTGFFCVYGGGLGAGRALGVGEVDFAGQIRPHDRVVRYEIDIVRFSRLPSTGAAIAISDATVQVDGDPIYGVKRARAGTFPDIDYADYPHASARAHGGRMER